MNTLLRSSLLHLAVLLCCLTSSLAAQTTSFTYQGRLTDGGASASGPYDLQFKLYDAVTGGNQIGASVLRDDVNVTNGVFSTTLDFGATAFPGAARWLEISVRTGASTGAYTTLTPRQPVNSTPYAIRALSAETVTGPVPASQITGTLPPSALPAGGAYINNATTQQASSNFNISGNGTVGGTLSGNVVNTATQYNIGGQRVLSTPGDGNVLTGNRAGESITTGYNNSFFGYGAGQRTQAGSSNSFFGIRTGGLNTSGKLNSFFGSDTGANNSTGEENSFFGSGTGNDNTTGSFNSFFGSGAGKSNVSGEENAYFGYRAGANTNAFGNSFFGSGAGTAAQTSYSSFFGRNAGRVTTNTSYDSFFGAEAGSANTTGRSNAFFGAYAGAVNTTGSYNTFIGYSAAPQHATGDNNTFVGNAAGLTQTSGNNNTLLGANANVSQAGLSFATAIGAGATVYNSNNVALGRDQDTVVIYGRFRIVPLQAPNQTQRQLCIDGGAYVVTCASSQRYKTNVQPLSSGLAVVNRLRPVTFTWQQNGAPDLGFIAEEVAAVEPLLTYHNQNGVIEGVQYNQISAVLVNAVKEQQAQIEAQQKQLKVQQEQFKQQQAELAQLKQLLCAAQPQAAVCQPKP